MTTRILEGYKTSRPFSSSTLTVLGPGQCFPWRCWLAEAYIQILIRISYDRNDKHYTRLCLDCVNFFAGWCSVICANRVTELECRSRLVGSEMQGWRQNCEIWSLYSMISTIQMVGWVAAVVLMLTFDVDITASLLAYLWENRCTI